ncbi:MAG: ABC transporter ATP-binding protein/permease [Defluviitaleaceae bacterium]|nr:ABC transporter ATP-binding protein/permease [Defluviitaleaceae bacterium]
MLSVKKKYTTFDMILLSFKISPFLTTLNIVITILQSILPTIVLTIAGAFFIDTGISIFQYGRDPSYIYIPIVLLIATYSFNNILSSIPEIVLKKIKTLLEPKVMSQIINFQSNIEYKHMEDSNTLEMIERINSKFMDTFENTNVAYNLYASTVISIFLIVSIVIAYVWWSALLVILVCIPLLYLASFIGKKTYDSEVKTYKHVRRYQYYSNEVLISREATEERTLFGYTENINARYLYEFEKTRVIRFWTNLKNWAFVKISSVFLILIAFILSMTLVNPFIYGYISPGMFTSVIVVIFGLVDSLGFSLKNATSTLSISKEYMTELSDFFGLSTIDKANCKPSNEDYEFRSLEFRNVSFKYPNSKTYILNNLSFKLLRGRHYAFVGVNGSGKTTITKLITRLYDDYDGEILLNGVDIRKYELAVIKSIFSVVHQDYAQYEISLKDNLFIGNENNNVSFENVEKVLRDLSLDEFLKDLKNVIDIPIGRLVDGSVNISGGTWQKIAIARALLNNAPIKILDEPTSALDPIAESQIYNDFKKISTTATTIFISHRLGSTKLADEILLVYEGSIKEFGNHGELMKLGSLYYDMFNSQKRWYE